MVKIRKDLVSSSVIKNASYGYGNPKSHIVIHETANQNPEQMQQRTLGYKKGGNSRAASWHYTVDDKEIVQSFPDDVKCWHSGSAYNSKSIGIEICVNSDGNFKKPFRMQQN